MKSCRAVRAMNEAAKQNRLPREQEGLTLDSDDQASVCSSLDAFLICCYNSNYFLELCNVPLLLYLSFFLSFSPIKIGLNLLKWFLS